MLRDLMYSINSNSEDDLKKFGMAYTVFSLSLPETRRAVNNVFVRYDAEGQHS